MLRSAARSRDLGKYNFCGKLWLSPDGSRMYTGCGVVLAVPPDVTASTPQYGGTLNQRIAFASWAASVKKVAVQPAAAQPYDTVNANADTTVRLYDDSFLTLVANVQLPHMTGGAGATVFSRGKFVFTSPSADKLFVIVQADAPNLGFALVTLVP